MSTLSKGIFIIKWKQAHMSNFLLLRNLLNSNILRCTTCVSKRYKIDSNNVNKLFPSIAVKHRDCSQAGVELTGELNKKDIVEIINRFYRLPETKGLAEENGLDDFLLQKGYIGFRKYCLEQPLPTDLHIVFYDLVRGTGNLMDLFPYYLDYIKNAFPHLTCLEDLKRIGDLRTPANWYPCTRQMERKVIFHCGPTNSGKTHHAIQRFLKAETGVYCAPLKLLAIEVCDKANEAGTPCDLVTGEEICYFDSYGEPSKHTSCTVEMCSLEKEYDVAVIDEIQMIKDNQRGWAWTRALLGIRAKEIHLCGEESAFDLLDSILCTTNESVEVKKYQRLTKLVIEDSLKSIKNVRDGDCIVCFNKADIYNVIRALEKIGIEPAVIYGSLPPGAKKAQCKKFNDSSSSCRVLVATDAVGMGLNLTATDERGCKKTKLISVSQALQIAGRAGRYGSSFSKGYVTTFKQRQFAELKLLLSQTPEPIEKAGIRPTIDQIELFSYFLRNSTLENIIEIFIKLSTVDDSLYFMCDLTDFTILAGMIDGVPLPLRTKYIFCCAPVNNKLLFVCTMFQKFARLYSENRVLTFGWICDNTGFPYKFPKNVPELLHLEAVHEVLDLYLWLSNRFPECFSDWELVKNLQTELDHIIRDGIYSLLKILDNTEALKLKLTSNLKESGINILETLQKV